jgi:hypothetical protein
MPKGSADGTSGLKCGSPLASRQAKKQGGKALLDGAAYSSIDQLAVTASGAELVERDAWRGKADPAMPCWAIFAPFT